MRTSLLATAILALSCGFSAYAQDADDSFQPTSQTYEGTLVIDLAGMGGETTTMDSQSLILTFDSQSTCTMTLCDFSFGEMVLGDIIVDNVAVSIDGTNLLFSGAKQGLSLAGGFITADVACMGTLSMETNLLMMDIDVKTMLMQIPVSFSGYPKVPEVEDAISYTGSITIPTEGDPVVVDNQTVTITPTGDDKCTFSLYNFNFNGMPLGDIVIENVQIATEDGNTIYTGAKDGLSLAGGMIVANVVCNGTEDSAGNLTMDIMVTLVGTDTIIPVFFNGQRSTGAIHSVVDESQNAPVEYYRINGIKVDAANLTPGLYILKQGSHTRKTLIR